MNKAYKSIYSEVTGTYVAVPETVKAKGKRSSSSKSLSGTSTVAKTVAGVALAMGLSGVVTNVYAQVNLGNASISGTGLMGGSGCSDRSAVVNGSYNIGLGCGAKVDGENNIVIGSDAQAAGGINNIVIGKNAVSDKSNGVVLGVDAKAEADRGIAIGAESFAGGNNESVALGRQAKAQGDQSIAIGGQANAVGGSSIAIGADDLDRVASTNPPAWNASGDNAKLHDTQVSKDYYRLTGDYLVNFIASGSTPEGDLPRYRLATAGEASVTVGTMALSGDLATALGAVATAEGTASVALGVKSFSEGEASLAIGSVSHAEGQGSAAIGVNSYANQLNAVAIGSGDKAGTGAYADGKSATAIGGGSKATADSSTAVGDGSLATLTGGVALGSSSTTTADSGVKGYDLLTNTASTNSSAVWQSTRAAVAVGDASKNVTRQITGVAAGTADTDAVNVAQLKQINLLGLDFAGDNSSDIVERKLTQKLDIKGGAAGGATTAKNIITTGNASDGSIQIDLAKDINLGADGSLAVGGVNISTSGIDAGGKKITNLAKGESNTDAVNLGQLNDALAGVGGGSWNYTADGGASNEVVSGATVDFGNTDDNIVITKGADGLQFNLADQITIGETSPITINGDAGTIGGLTNTTWDPDTTPIVSGQAATEDQLKSVSDVANAGWNLSGEGANEVNIGPEGEVNFVGDSNITVAQTGADQAGEIEITLNKDVNLGDDGSLTIGDTNITDGLVSVGGTNTITIDGDVGEISGLTNVDLDGADFGTVGRAATEEQLGLVNETANKGWNYTADGADETNVAPGATVDFGNTDDNIVITKGADGLEFNLANQLTVGESSPITINGDAGTIGGLTNTTWDPDTTPIVSGQAATEDQLKSVSDVANAGWNLSGEGANEVNIGPEGQVNFVGDSNITVAQTGADQAGEIEITLNKDVDLGADGSLTVGGTEVTDGSVTVAGGSNSIAIDGAAGEVTGLTNVDLDGADFGAVGRAATEEQLGLVNETANKGWNYTADGADETNVAPGATVDFGNTDDNIVITKGADGLEFNLANQLTVGESSPITINGDAGTIGGLTNTTWDPDTTPIVSGQAATEDQLKSVSDVANAGWNVSGSGANEVNIGPEGQVNFVGDSNITVAQTGADQAGEIEITLNKDVDLGADGSLAVGGTEVTDGSVTVAGGSNSIAIDGAAGEVTGLTNVDLDGADFGAVGRAATEEQLGLVNETANKGWNYTADGADETNVAPGATVDFGNTDDNIVITKGADGLEFNLANQLTVGESSPITINGDAGTIGGLTNTTWDPDTTPIVSGQAATEDQLKSVSDVANAGWNVSGSGANEVNIGPEGQVNFVGDSNITVAQTGADQAGEIEITLNKDVDLGADGSLTVGGTEVTDGSVTVAGGSNSIAIDGAAGEVTGLTNVDLDGADFGAVGRAATEEQLGLVNETANKGWNYTADGADETNVAPGATVDFGNTDDNIVITKGADGLEFNLANQLTVGESSPITINGDAGTIGGLTNTTWDPDTTPIVSGQAATEDQLKSVSDVANAGWNVSGSGANEVNIGPEGQVNFVGDSNITVAQTGADQAGEIEITLNKDVDLGADGSLAVGGTEVTDGSVTVAGGSNSIAIDGAAGEVTGLTNVDLDGADFGAVGRAATEEQLGLVNETANKGWNYTADGADETNVAPGATVDFGNTDDNIVITKGADGLEFNLANQLTVGESSPITINGDAGTIGGLTNTTWDPDTTPIVSGQAATEDQLKSVSDVANAGWNVSGSGANEVNIGPEGQVNFVGDSNITVAQTGADQAGEIEITLNKDVDLGTDGSVVAGGTKISNRGLTFVDESGYPIAYTPSISQDGIDGGMKQITMIDSGLGGQDLADVTGDDIYNAVNVGDLQHAAGEISDKGLQFSANAGGRYTSKLGSIVTVAGAVENEAWSNFDAGQNIMTQIEQDADGNSVIRVALSKDITGLETIILGENGTPGKDGVDGAPGVGIDGKDGSIGITGKDGAGADLTVAMGAPGLDGNDGVDGESKTRIVYEKSDGTTEEVATLNDGLRFVGDDGEVVERKLNETLGLVGGADVDALTENNIGVVQKDDGSLSIQLAENVDLGEDGTVTIGDTFIDNSSVSTTNLTVTGETKLGDNFYVTNEGDVTYTGNITEGDHIVNKSYVDGIGGDLKDLGLNFAGNTGATIHKELGETLGIVGSLDADKAASSKNIRTASNEAGELEILLAEDLVLTSLTTGETVMDNNGVRVGTNVNLTNEGLFLTGGPSISLSGIDAGGLTITNVAAGVNNTDAVNVSQLKDVQQNIDDLGDRAVKYDGETGSPKDTITLEGDKGTTITNLADGKIEAGSKDAVNGGQIHNMGESIASGMGGNSKFEDGKLITELNVAGDTYTNVNDALNGVHGDLSTKIENVENIANAGWNVTDAEGNTSNIGPNGSVAFVGDSNITVTQTGADNAGKVEISLSQDLQVNSITATTVNAEAVNTDKITINNGGPIISKDGIDMGGNRITNVAPGEEGTDAVNVDQLMSMGGNLQNQINQNRHDIKRNNDRANAGIAAAMATAGLPQAYLPGKSMVAVAGGVWRGESGMAIGVSTVSENGKWILKGSANTSGRGGAGGTIGAGYQW